MLVMNCISSTTLSVLVNGRPSPFFHPSRGLRQGDPLSPDLFLCVSDVLSALVSKACAVKQLHAISIATQGPAISHLLFADDSVFFMEASVLNAKSLLFLLQSYGHASGQKISFTKSSLFFSPNTLGSTKIAISDEFGIATVSNSGKYLGMPVIWERSKCAALAYIRDRVIRKLEGWKEHILTQAGKEILLKSVASALPVYPMNCFKFPKSLFKHITSELAKFWWGHDDQRGIHWQSWEALCRPKQLGGLGFRDLEDFNQALLAKQGWRIFNQPSSLWVQVLKARYFPNENFLEDRIGSSPSWLWASLLHGRQLLSNHLIWRIGNGIKLQFGYLSGFLHFQVMV